MAMELAVHLLQIIRYLQVWARVGLTMAAPRLPYKAANEARSTTKSREHAEGVTLRHGSWQMTADGRAAVKRGRNRRG